MRRVINKNLERGRHPARRRSAGRRGRPAAEAVLHDRPADRDRRTTCSPSPRSPSASATASPTAGATAAASAAVTVSLNAFVPKPWTPFQWDPMEPIASLRGKARAPAPGARAACPTCTLDVESPREAYLQTILSRGDRRVGAFHRSRARRRRRLVARHPRLAARRPRRRCRTPTPTCTAPTASDERFPWDFIDHRIAKCYLWVERRKAFAARQTAPCDTATCRSVRAAGVIAVVARADRSNHDHCRRHRRHRGRAHARAVDHPQRGERFRRVFTAGDRLLHQARRTPRASRPLRRQGGGDESARTGYAKGVWWRDIEVVRTSARRTVLHGGAAAAPPRSASPAGTCR